MAAPVVVALVAFLGGAQAPALGLVGMANVAVADVDGIVVDLQKACAATDPLIDRLGDAFPNSKTLQSFARAADRICAAAAGGPGIVADARLLGVVVQAFAAARAKLGAAPLAAPPAGPLHPQRMCGRSGC